jgi:hypothetical protein
MLDRSRHRCTVTRWLSQPESNLRVTDPGIDQRRHCGETRWLGDVDSNLRMAESMPFPEGTLPKKWVEFGARKAPQGRDLRRPCLNVGAHTYGCSYCQVIPNQGSEIMETRSLKTGLRLRTERQCPSSIKARKGGHNDCRLTRLLLSNIVTVAGWLSAIVSDGRDAQHNTHPSAIGSQA